MTANRTASIPAYDMPTYNRQVILTRRPRGIPVDCDFEIVTGAVPVPRDGGVLVRNLYLSVDPAQRGWATAVLARGRSLRMKTGFPALCGLMLFNSASIAAPLGKAARSWFSRASACGAGSGRSVLRAGGCDTACKPHRTSAIPILALHH